ncbi:MAG: hypothetical protein JOY60_03710 [Burkholderiaceae bacterium]|nr:hypothetical protein [Roseateles sp.]MBV8468953.1 hypothetical protein [Burkholderiaceae bacterium]
MKLTTRLVSLSLSALMLSVLSHAALAQDAAKAPTTQQAKMKTCNDEAKGKSGDERKTFMKECLSTQPATEAASAGKAMTPQQTRMKQCNADAKGKKGDERKAFMKECLSKQG